MNSFIITDLLLFDEQQKEKMGFESFEEMNQEIIKNWNSVVKKEDSVIIMGDNGTNNTEKLKSIIKKLNGKLYYLTDEILKKEQLIEAGFSFVWSICLFKEIDKSKKSILYCPFQINNFEPYKEDYKIIITSNKNKNDKMATEGIFLSAAADKWHYFPLNTNNLVEIFNNMLLFENMSN